MLLDSLVIRRVNRFPQCMGFVKCYFSPWELSDRAAFQTAGQMVLSFQTGLWQQRETAIQMLTPKG